jgi:Tfp pilus assembly protein PilF
MSNPKHSGGQEVNGAAATDANLTTEGLEATSKNSRNVLWSANRAIVVRLLFLLITLMTLFGLTDSVAYKITKTAWDRSTDMLQTSLIHSGVWLGVLTVPQGILKGIEGTTFEPEYSGIKIGKISGKLVEPISDMIKDVKYYLWISSILLVVQLALLKLIKLFSLKALVGFGSALCTIQFRRDTLFGRIGQLFIIIGLTTYFIYPAALMLGVNGFEDSTIQASTGLSEHFGVLKEKLSDVELVSTDFMKNISSIKDIAFEGLQITWNSFISWLFGEIIICVLIPVLTVAFIFFILQQTLVYMDMSSTAHAIEGGASRLLSTFGSRTRSRLADRMKKTKIGQRMTMLLILCLTLILPLLSGCQMATDNKTILEKAQSYVENGNAEAAINLLRPFVYHNPKDYKAHLILGNAFMSSNMAGNKELYLARYYFDSAKQLAGNDDERSAAAEAYGEAKSLMGKGSQDANEVFERAKRAELIGKQERAVLLYEKAGGLFTMSEKYEKAGEAFGRCITLTKDKGNPILFRLNLATVYYLNGESAKCLQTLNDVESVGDSINSTLALDPLFLKNAASFVAIRTDRNLSTFWKTTVSPENQQKLDASFSALNDAKYKASDNLQSDRAILLARCWERIGGHAADLDRLGQAEIAFETSRSLYSQAGKTDDAQRMGKRLAEFSKQK